MTTSRKIVGIGLGLLVFMGGMAFAGESPSPPGLVVRDVFEPGIGNPVGQIEMVRGVVLIIHADMPDGYRAAEGQSLYVGDTIITTETGRIRFRMLDGSLLTLASDTKLIINNNVFDSSMKTRLSFFNMISGKARFLVRKLVGYKRSDFEVRTVTAIVGVRGSDFVVESDKETTRVVALDETNIFVLNLSEPDAEPVRLSEFERAVVKDGVLEKSEASRDMIDSVKREFRIPGDLTKRLEKKDLQNHGGIRIPEDRLVRPAIIGTHGGEITDTHGAIQRKLLESRDQIDALLEEHGETGGTDGQTPPTGTGGTGGSGGTI